MLGLLHVCEVSALGLLHVCEKYQRLGCRPSVYECVCLCVHKCVLGDGDLQGAPSRCFILEFGSPTGLAAKPRAAHNEEADLHL